MMNNNNTAIRLHAVLAFAGTLPFIIPTVLLLQGWRHIPFFGELTTAVTLYGLMIAVFMAGSHWGLQISRSDRWAYWLSITSNAHVIALWICGLILPTYVICAALIISFILLLITDIQLRKAHIISAQYATLRIIVTIIVITSLMVLFTIVAGLSL